MPSARATSLTVPVLLFCALFTLVAPVGAAEQRAAPVQRSTWSGHDDRVQALPRLAPGRFGRARIGMSVEDAIATGYFRATPSSLCGQEAEFRRTWLRRGLNSYVYADGITSISVSRAGIETTKGAHVGTRVSRLRATYSGLVGPYRTMWIDGPAWWAHVRTRNDYLTFFLSGRRAESTVLHMAVSKGKAGGFGAGC